MRYLRPYRTLAVGLVIGALAWPRLRGRLGA